MSDILFTDEDLKNATDSVPEFSLSGKTISCKVVSCYDGDTIHIVTRLDDGKLWKFCCRIDGYDCPEMKPSKDKPNRDLEKLKAVVAKQALLSHLCDNVLIGNTMSNEQLNACVKKNKKIIKVVCKEFDKYGRVLIDCFTANNESVSSWMIANKYGYVYSGGTKDSTFFMK